jgi:hypothetical protein
MDAAIQQLRHEGYPVQDEDVEKLSPLQCGHINMQGRYSFTVPESVSKCSGSQSKSLRLAISAYFGSH